MTNFVHTDDYDQDTGRQLEDMKRLVLMLFKRLDRDRIEIDPSELYEAHSSRAEITIWPDRLTDKVIVEIRTSASADPVDAETVNEVCMQAVEDALRDRGSARHG